MVTGCAVLPKTDAGEDAAFDLAPNTALLLPADLAPNTDGVSPVLEAAPPNIGCVSLCVPTPPKTLRDAVG